MMVSDAEIDAINIAHKGNIVGEVIEGSYKLIADTKKSLGAVRNWTQLQLTDGKQRAFADSAHAIRFADADGKITAPRSVPLTPRAAEVLQRRQSCGRASTSFRAGASRAI